VVVNLCELVQVACEFGGILRATRKLKSCRNGREGALDHSYVERVVDLTDPEANQIYNMDVEQACGILLNQPAAAVRQIHG